MLTVNMIFMLLVNMAAMPHGLKFPCWLLTGVSDAGSCNGAQCNLAVGMVQCYTAHHSNCQRPILLLKIAG